MRPAPTVRCTAAVLSLLANRFFLSQIIIGSLGAIIDVSVTVTSVSENDERTMPIPATAATEAAKEVKVVEKIVEKIVEKSRLL